MLCVGTGWVIHRYIYKNCVLYIFRVGFARSMNNKKRRRKMAKMYIFFLFLYYFHFSCCCCFFFVQGSYKQWQCYTARAQGRLRRMNVLCVSDGKKERSIAKKWNIFNTYTFFYSTIILLVFLSSFHLICQR